MANDKDFLVNGPVAVGKDMKVTVGSTTSGSVAGNDLSSWASYGNFLVGRGETTPTGVYIKPDGTKMYVVGNANDTVFQYSLSTAWDVTTASYDSVSKSISAQETTPYDLFFKDDGTSMYIIGQTSDAISQYTLSTAWDVSTASYLQEKSVSAQGTEPRGLYFKSDGLRVFTADAATNSVFSYTLSTAWDISTAGYDSKSLVTTSDGEDNPQGVAFNQDGTFLYVVGDGARAILQYQLTTAYDLSTATITSSSYAFDQNIGGIHINPDNTKVYLVDYSQDAVTQITSTLKTEELDLSTGNYFSHTLTENTKFPLSNAGDVQSFQLEVTGGNYNNDPWARGGTFLQSFSYNAETTRAYDVSFKTDGTKMYLLDGIDDSVIEYNLSTAWDVSTSTYIQELSVQSQEGSPRGMFFKPDGTKMYLTGLSNFVYEYDLTTAWDISTLSYLQSFDVDDQDTTVSNIFFRDDGIKMYMVGQSSNDVHEYDLSTAWDVSTLSYLRSDALTGLETSVRGLFFKSDGTLMYVVGDSRNELQIYELSNPWSVTSASLDFFRSVSAEDLTPLGLFFKSDGSKMYITGDTNDSVYEYDIGEFIDFTITWPSSIEWAYGIAPSAPANDETDVFTLSTDDGGTSYVGVKTADNLS